MMCPLEVDKIPVKILPIGFQIKPLKDILVVVMIVKKGATEDVYVAMIQDCHRVIIATKQHIRHFFELIVITTLL